MKIIEIREKTVPFGSRIANSYINFSKMTGSVVAIKTDVIRDGKPVIGYGFNSIGRYACSSILRDRMIPKIMNARPEEIYNDDQTNLDPIKIYKVLKSNEKPGGHGDRAHAIGAIDMAVWDTVAKIEGKPLYRLLAERYNNGVYDKKIYTYGAGGYYYDEDSDARLTEELKSYLDLGFRDVKMKIGGADLKTDMHRIEVALKLLNYDGSRLMVDANGKQNIPEALEYAKEMKQYHLRWYEEPVDPLDYEDLAILSENYEHPLATGENLFSFEDIRNLIRHGNLRADRDFIQMDCPLSYGLVEYMKVLEFLKAMGWSSRRCIPHGGHQFCANIAAGLNLGGNENYPGVFQPFGGFADNIPVENGYVMLPDVPGIGFECKANLWEVLKNCF